LNKEKIDYGLEIDEKLWNLILLFSNLSVMNAVKKFSEIKEHRDKIEDLVSLLYEEYQEL